MFYRRCSFIFSLNNQFHKHLRSAKCIKNFSNLYINSLKNNLTKFLSKIITYSNNVEMTIFHAKNSIFLIRLKVDSNKDIKIESEFKEWQYVTANVYLFLNVELNTSYIDFEAEITFADENFFKKKINNIFIKTITISISI